MSFLWQKRVLSTKKMTVLENRHFFVRLQQIFETVEKTIPEKFTMRTVLHPY
tara:strand:+ start:305 stop:460 length:156 start_codon:yes stop_codon:yes gene_type:complete